MRGRLGIAVSGVSGSSASAVVSHASDLSPCHLYASAGCMGNDLLRVDPEHAILLTPGNKFNQRSATGKDQIAGDFS